MQFSVHSMTFARELYILIPHKKMADPYFFLQLSSIHVKLWPFEKLKTNLVGRISKYLSLKLETLSADRR